MITGTFLAYATGFLLAAFFLYMSYGRDVDDPIWIWIGIPGTVITILSIGYFYYDMPIIDWSK